MNEYYVYEWFNIDTGDVFYVGKGKKDRWKSLKSRSKAFKEYYNSHNCDVRKIKDNMREEDAYALEKETILRYKNISTVLCNIDDGGRALPILNGKDNPMYGVSPKERMSEDTYKEWKFKHTLITGDKNPNYGKHTLKNKYRMNKDEALRRQSRPGAQNGRAIPVKVYNEKHEFIREFSYIGEACDYLIEIGATNSSKDNIRGGIWKANKKRSLYLKHYFEY